MRSGTLDHHALRICSCSIGDFELQENSPRCSGGANHDAMGVRTLTLAVRSQGVLLQTRQVTFERDLPLHVRLGSAPPQTAACSRSPRCHPGETSPCRIARLASQERPTQMYRAVLDPNCIKRF
jgi:hypothetical protein